MTILGLFSREKLVTAAVAAFFGLVAFDGERALNKIDALYELSQSNTQQIGINKTAIELLASDDKDHETRIRVLEHESYAKKPIAQTIPTEWYEPSSEEVLASRL